MEEGSFALQVIVGTPDKSLFSLQGAPQPTTQDPKWPREPMETMLTPALFTLRSDLPKYQPDVMFPLISLLTLGLLGG